jgi:hypothetical protein
VTPYVEDERGLGDRWIYDGDQPDRDNIVAYARRLRAAYGP